MDLKQALADEAERVREDAEHSAKRQYNAADRWARYHLFIGLPAALVAGLGSAAALKNCPDLAGALGLLATALTTVLTFLKPSERSELHKASAGRYLTLRNQARIFKEIELLNGLTDEAAKARLLKLGAERDALNSSSPATIRADYELGKKDIDEGRANYRVDEARR